MLSLVLSNLILLASTNSEQNCVPEEEVLGTLHHREITGDNLHSADLRHHLQTVIAEHRQGLWLVIWALLASGLRPVQVS